MTVDEETHERIRAVVAAIPPGTTSTYGKVAADAGVPGRARLVGRILAEDSHDLPWHRVLRANGTCAPHLAHEQAARLRAEGVLLVDGRLPRPARDTPEEEDVPADVPGGRPDDGVE